MLKPKRHERVEALALMIKGIIDDLEVQHTFWVWKALVL